VLVGSGGPRSSALPPARSTQHHDRRAALFNTQLNEEPVTTSLDWPCLDYFGAATRFAHIISLLILSLAPTTDRLRRQKCGDQHAQPHPKPIWPSKGARSLRAHGALADTHAVVLARERSRDCTGGCACSRRVRCVCVCATAPLTCPRHDFVDSHTLSPSLFPPPLVTPMLISSTATASTAAASTPAWLMATRFGFYSSDLHQHTPPHRWLPHSVARTCPPTTRRTNHSYMCSIEWSKHASSSFPAVPPPPPPRLRACVAIDLD
jgi:hypothetical protein